MSTKNELLHSLPWKDEPFHSQASNWWTNKLLIWGVESRGIRPVPIEERTDTQLIKIFFIWFSANFNILSFVSGTLGPVAFGLGLRDTCLCILFFNLLCNAPPAYFTVWGYKLGMRQMIVSRYSFGFYGVIVTCILNLITMCGFSILSFIVGGQTLSSAADGHLTWTVGIVITGVVSLLVSFCGMKVLMWFERIVWIPVFIAFLVATGVGGRFFSSPAPSIPATATSILGFASTLAGFAITYSTISSDFSTYFHPEVSSWKMFWYSYIGLLLSTVPLQILGAAAAIASVTSWGVSYESGDVGGLLADMLGPTGGFGKFLLVLLSLSNAANLAEGFYSFSINLQAFIPFLIVVPRYVLSIVAMAITLPISIVGAHKFYATLNNFLGVIGYWASAYVGVILTEHLIFRRNDFERYDVRQWDKARKLPSGIAALGAGILSFGLVVPCMAQAWYTGPIARTTGDIGFEVALVLSALLYVPFRALEIRIRA